MKYVHEVEVVIKDGNRTVNWLFPDSSTFSDVLDKWEKNYFPCNRKRVLIDWNKRLTENGLKCQLSCMGTLIQKIIMRVETIKPKKEVKRKMVDAYIVGAAAMLIVEFFVILFLAAWWNRRGNKP